MTKTVLVAVNVWDGGQDGSIGSYSPGKMKELHNRWSTFMYSVLSYTRTLLSRVPKKLS